MAKIKRPNLFAALLFSRSAVFIILSFCAMATASELPKAFLDAPAILQAWQRNYGSIKTLQVSYTKRVLDFKLPEPNPLEISAPIMYMHVERIEEGKRCHTRYSLAEDGFAKPENILEHAFDGSTTTEYWGREKVGTIEPGLIGRSVEGMNALKQYMLLDLKPVSGELAQEYPNGMPRFSRTFNSGILKSIASVRPNLEPVAGHLCHVVEIDYKSEGFNSQYKFWVAHEKEMLTLKYQEYHNDKLKEEIQVEQIAVAETDGGNIYYPIKSYRTIDTELLGMVKSEVITHAFVPNIKVDENTFRIDFPSGTRVFDRELGLDYIVGIE